MKRILITSLLAAAALGAAPASHAQNVPWSVTIGNNGISGIAVGVPSYYPPQVVYSPPVYQAPVYAAPTWGGNGVVYSSNPVYVAPTVTLPYGAAVAPQGWRGNGWGYGYGEERHHHHHHRDWR